VHRSRHAVEAAAGVERSFPAGPQLAAARSAADTIHTAHRDASTSASASSSTRAHTWHLPAYVSSHTCWSLPATND